MPIVYYHATSYENAISIMKTAFRPSVSGSLGNGIYFAESPESALYKANCNIKDAIIVVYLNEGKILDVTRWEKWTKQKLNSLGYDSVRKINCHHGNEICIFDNDRIKIIGCVHWNKSSITVKENNDCSIDLSKFGFLLKNRKVIILKNNELFCWTQAQFILFGSYMQNNM